jgi:hypothetical protein
MDLAHNNIKFRATYKPAQPIKALFSQIEDTMDFADAGIAVHMLLHKS